MFHTCQLACCLLVLLLILKPACAQTQSASDVLLNGAGDRQITARQQLEALQQQIDQQSKQVTDPRQQLQMIQQRLEILFTLATDARLNQQPGEAAKWQQALRADAWKLRQSDNPRQKLVGEYWHLLCDLADLRRLAQNIESGQRACIQRMQQFLDSHANLDDPIEPQAMHLLQQVQLALLQLYDQRGQSTRACKLINLLKQQDPENQPLRHYLQQNYGYCHLIGQTFKTRLKTTDGKIWDSREKHGKSIVIYFWPGAKISSPGSIPAPGDIPSSAHGIARVPGSSTSDNLPQPNAESGALSDARTPPSDPLWERLKDTYAEVLLIDLSHSLESGMQIPASPWPSYRQEKNTFSLTDFFHIQTLPRIVVIDKNGVIRSIGRPASIAVLDRLLSEK